MIFNGAIKLGMYFPWLFTFSEDCNFQWNLQFTNTLTILTYNAIVTIFHATFFRCIWWGLPSNCDRAKCV